MTADASPSRPNKRRRGAGKPAPRVYPDPPRRILLVSPSIPLTRETIQKAVELATPLDAKITVLGIAKIYGTSLGLPHPGLQPTNTEWELERQIAHEAAEELEGRGFEVRVALSRARNIPKMIARWGVAKNFHAIVVPEAERPGWRRAIEGDVAREIGRRTDIPVHVVPVPSQRGAGAPQDRRG
jgi:nucleotide-binding universal stress UspA family protein